MTDSQHQLRAPSAKQIRYLRDLALQRGESFAYPKTAAEASAEIDRLKSRKRMSASDRRREARELSRQMAERGGDAAAVKPFEVSGYGSSATWSARR
jgi:hypothetical protein